MKYDWLLILVGGVIVLTAIKLAILAGEALANVFG